MAETKNVEASTQLTSGFGLKNIAIFSQLPLFSFKRDTNVGSLLVNSGPNSDDQRWTSKMCGHTKQEIPEQSRFRMLPLKGRTKFWDSTARLARVFANAICYITICTLVQRTRKISKTVGIIVKGPGSASCRTWIIILRVMNMNYSTSHNSHWWWLIFFFR